MKATLVALALISTIAVGMPVAHADVVTVWNETALGAIRTAGSPPTAASRNLAILHCADPRRDQRVPLKPRILSAHRDCRAPEPEAHFGRGRGHDRGARQSSS